MEDFANTGKQPFFRRIDWASFWTATALSFLVYFLTLGPSVGLEDSGELAVAGDHLGVPHPPGYPIWTMISFCLARIFSFVTFRGQPNPAWAIALGSAIFGALAAGCTAMLITRSASDMLASMGGEGEDEALRRTGGGGGVRGEDSPRPFPSDTILSYVGGVAGSLIFAFSPVMWSQSTIVEVYSLGAFFLMLVMLLTYRWMRRPTDKLLWITAFVFGLGLTNYQVLLLAALPLVVIIFLRNIALFRDFLLVLIPFGLACVILKLGSLNQQTDLPKRIAIRTEVAIPNGALCTAGAVAFGLALAVMLFAAWRKRVGSDLRALRRDGAADNASAGRSEIAPYRGVALIWAAGLLLGLSLFLFVLAGLAAKSGIVGTVNPANQALLEPIKYLRFATLLVGVLGLSAFAAAFGGEKGEKGPLFTWPLAGAAAFAAIALLMALALPRAALPAGIEMGGVPTLGIGRYNAMIVVGLAAMVALAVATPRSLVFALPIAAIEGILYILVLKGVLLGLTHPSTWWFCAPAIFNFAMFALAALALPNGVSVAMTIIASEIGLAFYAYMPIVSDLRNPPMNWGYPRTWEGFKHAITRGQYEAIKPTNIFTMKFVHQVGDYFIDLRRQFTLLLAPFGFLPFAAWELRRPPRPQDGGACNPARGSQQDGVRSTMRRVTPFRLALACIAATAVFVVLGKLPATGAALNALRIDKVFIGGLLLIGGFGGLLCVWRQLSAAVIRIFRRGADGKEDTPSPAPEAVPRLFSPLFDDISQQWLIGTVCNFLVMSVVLIMLANPKGDLQDTFIQKVKFISSHGLFAIWIGYGLVFALVLCRTILGAVVPCRAILGAVTLAVFLTPLIPIEQNYFNDRLVFELSGAEQNGHDYGWQFGNYQLRGADAIREELEPDEEPLPNPLYPPEMGQGAVFFGGTDPGRFVPTYMIYSADVRPDVFLITQNALADNTFMSVTRDLYGDQLWIPTPKDSEAAFSEFVEDVRTGRRQANSDIVVENGRVQVVGALGVMEINGILCEKIFEHNKRWHDFYVEESYVIPWMYPYLTPHGLIMKINAERTPLTTENTEDDMDFWDWYVRRMTRDGRYRRDIVAQKSFSKLRSAIAGLYMSRGRTADGERAYNDARVLYPVSPEATFRYVQDVLMRQRRYAEALEAIGYFCRQDPNNDRGPYVRGVIEDIVRDEERLKELTSRFASGAEPTPAEAFEMATLMLKTGASGRARQLLAGFIDRQGLSVADCLTLAKLLDETGDVPGAARAMDRVWRKNSVRQNADALRTAVDIYQRTGDIDKLSELLPLAVKASPTDWRAWLALCGLRAAKGDMDTAAKALEEAVRYGGDSVAEAIQKNPSLMEVYRHLVEKKRRAAPQRMPGAPW